MLNQNQTVKDNIEKYNKPNPLADYLVPLIDGKKEVKILDVGSGPYSIIGSYLKGVKLEITHCDNQNFTQFYNKHGVTPLVKIEKQNMEQMSYPDNYFDIVCCINALDHTPDAYKAVEEMLQVCKPGGYVYIECNLNQMDTGHRHYWNVKANGAVMNNTEVFDLRNFGFAIEFIDYGGEDRYNKVIARLKK